ASKSIGAGFDSASSKAGGAIERLGHKLENLGIPGGNALASFGKKLDETETKGQKFGKVFSAIGGAALIGGAAMAVRIAASLTALAVLPPADVVAGLGIGFGLSSLATAAALGWVLSRRVGGLDGRRIRSSLVRMHLAAIPGVIFALAVSAAMARALPSGTTEALATVAIGGSGGLLLYVLAARALRVSELSDLSSMLRARLRG
ncbi:MAG TPA: hypothetical protein DEH11_14495, partial [Actinobacteria bacterium]|nr:hypothetical protein [Actinomycetota bacterium]